MKLLVPGAGNILIRFAWPAGPTREKGKVKLTLLDYRNSAGAMPQIHLVVGNANRNSKGPIVVRGFSVFFKANPRAKNGVK